MGSGTNFDKHTLQEAADELVRLSTITSTSTSLKKINEVSRIDGDVSGLDDKNGGWSWLSGEVSDVSSIVADYVQRLQATAESVHQAMQASIGTLVGADNASRSGVNQSGAGLPDSSHGRGQ